MKKNAFTFIELLTVFFIMAVIFAIAVPAFGPQMTTFKLKSAAENLANALRTARQYAITHNQECVVIFPMALSLGIGYYLRSYKICLNDTNKTSVSKWHFLPRGLKFYSGSTAFTVTKINVPFPEDTNTTNTPAVNYVICRTDGTIVRTDNESATIAIFCDKDNDNTYNASVDGANSFLNVTIHNYVRDVNVKNVGEGTIGSAE